ncbi:O-linked N-acetylglucosamine transferase, SPINDLY family protein [Altericista sp. CCNU0014]|uniref:O-linked N-acetylglucosamine transferase, SPINDLY family protein n=1 Tax=Altericista sp. CCNU0014 TaxID=3082949 RepID=UPI00384FA956
MNNQKIANNHLIEGQYEEAVRLYEQLIQEEPDISSHYWHLGLVYLLQGLEDLAQTTWQFYIAHGSDIEIDVWIYELIEVLETEAQHQSILNNIENSWLIRQHIREIKPNEINNLLYLVLLTVDLNSFSLDLIEQWNLLELICNTEYGDIDSELLLKTLIKLLKFPSTVTINFLEVVLARIPDSRLWIDALTTCAIEVADQLGQPEFAVQIVEANLCISPEDFRSLQYLYIFYDKCGNYKKSLEAANLFLNQCSSPIEKAFGNYLVTQSFIKLGRWSNSDELIKRYKSSIKEVINTSVIDAASNVQFSLIVLPTLLEYLQDNPHENSFLQNGIANLFQENVKKYTPSKVFKQSKKSDRLRIGYIAHTFRVHSVGWLSRWLFHYHDKERFDIGLYFVNQNTDNNFSKTWFKDKATFYRTLGINPQEISEQIVKDEIDILVDLDSTTFNGTCIVMAFKSAPIQVTWLGKNASGIPAIDYYIADPYVLPDNAQDYYQEKIWRLPQTYIAVNGFESDVSTLRRDDLNIPSDGIVYLTAQNGLKRHPDTIRLQLQILKEVKKSYLLVKGYSDEEAIQRLFIEIAEEEGVALDRLRFLPMAPNEFIHRANLHVADVVLDTYPYNGATTTLETLWAGIPLVTRVGQQFAARNSYTFLMNVGVSEGIAWNEEEYVKWGVKFGTDELLRQKVCWKLRQSRQTSPLWDAKQFTREIESAYTAMWENSLKV